MVSHEMLGAGRVRSTIRELFEYGRHRAQEVGEENVFDFSLGNPSVPPPREVTDAFINLLTTSDPMAIHGYTSAPGDNRTRDAIAASLNRRFGTQFSRRNLYLTCGAAAALTSTFRALTTDAKTEFIALAPFFPEYSFFATTAGATLRVVEADTQHFQIDFDKLERTINQHTQGVIINSPNNPSGVIYSKETLVRLSGLLRKKSAEYGHPVYLIADEPYRELSYLDEPAPFITELYDCAIVCYSYSKSFSLPGDRIGYVLLGNGMPDFDDVFDAIAGSARVQGYVCAPAILQRVVQRCSEQDVLPDLTIYRKNRDALYNALSEIGYRCIPPDGAFYLFVEAPNGDGDAFSELAKQEDILVVSGRSFGCPEFVRISYCVGHDTILRAMPGFKRLFERIRAK